MQFPQNKLVICPLMLLLVLFMPPAEPGNDVFQGPGLCFAACGPPCVPPAKPHTPLPWVQCGRSCSPGHSWGLVPSLSSLGCSVLPHVTPSRALMSPEALFSERMWRLRDCS